MTTIVPISDLRNYTDVLNKVDAGQSVYLTRNGRGAYRISRIDDDFDREAAISELTELIRDGKARSKSKPRESIEAVAEHFGVTL